MNIKVNVNLKEENKAILICLYRWKWDMFWIWHSISFDICQCVYEALSESFLWDRCSCWYWLRLLDALPCKADLSPNVMPKMEILQAGSSLQTSAPAISRRELVGTKKWQCPWFCIAEKMKFDEEEGTDRSLVNGCQEVARTEESPGEEAGEEGSKNDKEIVLIQDMGFNVQIQIPGGNPIELPVSHSYFTTIDFFLYCSCSAITLWFSLC